MSEPSFRIRPDLRREWIQYRRTSLPTQDAYLRAGVAGAYLPRVRLEVPHLVQEHVSQSVPCCLSMVLRYHGVQMEPDYLATILGTDDLYGTPGRRLKDLKAWGIQVDQPKELQRFRDGTLAANERVATETARLVYRWENPWLAYVRDALLDGKPPVLFVDLGRMSPTWRGLTQPHAVVLVGGDGRQGWINDPSRSYGPVRVGLCTLMDALLPGEPLAAVLSPAGVVRSLEAGESRQ